MATASSSPTSDGTGNDGDPTDASGVADVSDEFDELPDVPELSYEAARDELSSIVGQLEGGQVPLDEGMRLWRRGEALAAHCTAWLDGAQRQISEAGPASAP